MRLFNCFFLISFSSGGQTSHWHQEVLSMYFSLGLSGAGGTWPEVYTDVWCGPSLTMARRFWRVSESSKLLYPIAFHKIQPNVGMSIYHTSIVWVYETYCFPNTDSVGSSKLKSDEGIPRNLDLCIRWDPPLFIERVENCWVVQGGPPTTVITGLK